MRKDALAKLLVVDDDADLRDTLQDWLTMEGYEVRLAGDGLEALEWARWDAFDLVVTDLKMPNLDGLGLLSQLKALDADVQVVFLSGEASKADVIEALREGRSFDFLEKPLTDLSLLSRTIARALARRPARGEASQESAASGAQHPVLAAVFAFIEANLDQAISLRHVADAVGYSPAYLTALVRQTTGMPVTQWIAEIRMAEAKRRLSESGAPVAEIALAVGISDASYFSRLFRKVVGVTPLAWREASRRA